MHKVLIRPLAIEDASISFQWRNDPQVWELTGSKPDIFITEEIEKKWIEQKLLEKNSIRFAIIVDDIYVGNIQFTNIIQGKTAEYHIFIGDKNYWGKGIAKLATSQIIRFAENTLNLHEIYLHVNPLNLRAINVYLNTGFVKVNDTIEMKLIMNQKPFPMVSVFMMAYNHEAYIAEALDNILMQKTNFDFDIVIGEDCSTDNTRQIILDYQKKYPGKFKLLLHKKNIGAVANQGKVFDACNGKYIALCEGDDYWTDPYKLQKQVDFLEGNEEYAICGSLAEMVFEDPSKNKIEGKAGEFSQIDLAKENFIPSATALFHTKYIKELPQWFAQCPIGDWPLFLHCANYGKIKVFDELMAVHRVHSGGVWTQHEINNNFYKQKLVVADLLEVLKTKFSIETNKILEQREYAENINIGLHALRINDFSLLLKILNKITDADSLNNEIINKLNSQSEEIRQLQAEKERYRKSLTFRVGTKIKNFYKLTE